MPDPIPLMFAIEPVIYRLLVPKISGKKTNLAQLCQQAEVRLRATVPPRVLRIYTGTKQIRTPDVDIIGVPVEDLESREAALRALEALAHSFHDHSARVCVCGRGLFSPVQASSI